MTEPTKIPEQELHRQKMQAQKEKMQAQKEKVDGHIAACNIERGVQNGRMS
jgi:hypothetical protein